MSETTSKHDPFATKQSGRAFFQRLEKLRFDCGPNTGKPDQARVLITACLDENIRQGQRIVGILAKLGFTRQHVGKTLHKHCGVNPAIHDWWTDENGDYHVHTNTALEAAAKIRV